jgi:O-antigen ligase
MVAASAASGSRGGLAAVSAGVLVGVAPALRHRPRLMLASAFAVLLVLFGTGIPAAFARLADVDFEASRLMVWRDVVRLIEFFPIFGCGIGAFAPAYWPYQRVVRFEYWPHVHNEYLQWSLETGVVGLILASVLARAAWLAAPRIARDPQLRPALAGVTASLAHALVDCGFRVPANASWAAVLVVCLFLSSGRGSRGK